MNVSFRPGDLLGRYTIVAPIGSGGMGEVYKALDPTLDRTVALKVLPPELVRNDERVRRFVQEAKSASSLTHPNIVTIYEIGTAASTSAGDDDGKPIHYIAMELVDGPTLKRLIHEERLDLRTLVRYLAQAAEGLAKAHAAGIVHRDLKPENIVVSKDGFAKVLDFGLAKLTERSDSGVSDSRTVVREQTREGIVVGTVGYMSPEQVQAKTVDHRSDIFSFGCILYEAASRRKPFVADSDIDVMHKIVHDKPEPLDAVMPPVPGELRRIIRRCLAKEPDKRFHSMKDLAIDLAEIDEQWDELSASSSVSGSGSSVSGAVPVTARMSRRSMVLTAAAAIAILAVIAAGIYRGTRPRPGVQKPDSFSAMKIAPATVTGNVRAVAISPDGKYLAQARSTAGGFDIVIRQIVTGSDATIVPQASNEVFGIAFSPDGNYLYYVQRNAETIGFSTLFAVPTLGGRPKKILFDIDSTPSFSPDGKQISFIRGNPPAGEAYVIVANADGTAPRTLSTVRSPQRYLNDSGAAWSPDGKTIVTASVSDRTGLASTLEAADVATGKRQPLGTSHLLFPVGLTWLPDGSGLVLAASEATPAQPRQLWLVSWPEGDVRRITNDLTAYGHPAITADGKVLATTQARPTSLLWRQQQGQAEPRQIGSGSGYLDQLSASSQAVVFIVPSMSGVGIWTAALDGSDMRPLISNNRANFDPAVPADGRFIMYASFEPNGAASIWRAERDGSDPRRLVSDATLVNNHMLSVAPNGEWFVYSPGDGRTLLKVPSAGGKAEQLADRFAGEVRVAPDSKSIFGFVWQEGTAGRAGRIFHLSGAPATAITPHGRDYRWAADSQALTFLRDEQGVTNVWRQSLDDSAPAQLTHFTSGRIFTHVWAPDGTLLLGKGEVSRDAVLISDFR